MIEAVPGPPPKGIPAKWITGAKLDSVPKELRGLVTPFLDWTAESWCEYLEYKAARCEIRRPEFVRQYRAAVALMREAAKEPSS